MMVSLLIQTGYPYFLSLTLTNNHLYGAKPNDCEGLRGGHSFSSALQKLVAGQALSWKARGMASSSDTKLRELNLGLIYPAVS